MVLSARVYAQAIEGQVRHLRTAAGEQEIDIIVQKGSRVIAIEVKLAETPRRDDFKSLLWLKERLGDELPDACAGHDWE